METFRPQEVVGIEWGQQYGGWCEAHLLKEKEKEKESLSGKTRSWDTVTYIMKIILLFAGIGIGDREVLALRGSVAKLFSSWSNYLMIDHKMSHSLPEQDELQRFY